MSALNTLKSPVTTRLPADLPDCEPGFRLAQSRPVLNATVVQLNQRLTVLVDPTGDWHEIAELADPELKLLAQLDGKSTWQELINTRELRLQARFTRLLRCLLDANLVQFNAASTLEVRVHGEGELATRLRCCFPGRDIWHADLVVLADAYQETDRGLVSQLKQSAIAYLPVLADRDWARIGPLCVPGRSPGLCCLDKQRQSQFDNYWRILAKLSALPSSPCGWAVDWLTAHTRLCVEWLQRHNETVLFGQTLSAFADRTGCSKYVWQAHRSCCPELLDQRAS